MKLSISILNIWPGDVENLICSATRGPLSPDREGGEGRWVTWITEAGRCTEKARATGNRFIQSCSECFNERRAVED